jgi:hypothetical protein
MSAQTQVDPKNGPGETDRVQRADVPALVLEVLASPEGREAVRQAVTTWGLHQGPRERLHRPPPEVVRAAMERIEERRKRIAMPPEELEALLEEHRREFHRGPLVDEDEGEA